LDMGLDILQILLMPCPTHCMVLSWALGNLGSMGTRIGNKQIIHSVFIYVWNNTSTTVIHESMVTLWNLVMTWGMQQESFFFWPRVLVHMFHTSSYPVGGRLPHPTLEDIFSQPHDTPSHYAMSQRGHEMNGFGLGV
jgi:hypothetical protein